MTNVNLTTKGRSPTDLIEKKSIDIVKTKLPVEEAEFIWIGGKYPNYDGMIEFFGDNGGSTTIKLFFQLKGSQRDIKYHDCCLKFINYCFKCYDPMFLIFVNIPQQKVYWEYISQTYITSILGIKDLTTFHQKTKRIKFSKEKVIDNNAKTLEEVCRKHHENVAEIRKNIQEAESKGESVSRQKLINSNIKEDISSSKQEVISTLHQVSSQKNGINTNVFDCLKKKFEALIRDIPNKLMLYYAFVYILKPFYLDQRGEKNRMKLIDLMKITDSQERFIIESLINSNFLGRVGNLIFVVKKEDALSIINNYIDSGQLNLEKITGLFS